MDRPTNPGVAGFPVAFVHANGMLGLGGLSRSLAFNDMLTKPRPTAWADGLRLVDAAHPEMLVAKACIKRSRTGLGPPSGRRLSCRA